MLMELHRSLVICRKLIPRVSAHRLLTDRLGVKSDIVSNGLDVARYTEFIKLGNRVMVFLEEHDKADLVASSLSTSEVEALQNFVRESLIVSPGIFSINVRRVDRKSKAIKREAFPLLKGDTLVPSLRNTKLTVDPVSSNAYRQMDFFIVRDGEMLKDVMFTKRIATGIEPIIPSTKSIQSISQSMYQSLSKFIDSLYKCIAKVARDSGKTLDFRSGSYLLEAALKDETLGIDYIQFYDENEELITDSLVEMVDEGGSVAKFEMTVEKAATLKVSEDAVVEREVNLSRKELPKVKMKQTIEKSKGWGTF